MGQEGFWRDSFRLATVWTPGLMSEESTAQAIPGSGDHLGFDKCTCNNGGPRGSASPASVFLNLRAPRYQQTPASLDLWHLLEPTTCPPAP